MLQKKARNGRVLRGMYRQEGGKRKRTVEMEILYILTRGAIGGLATIGNIKRMQERESVGKKKEWNEWIRKSGWRELLKIMMRGMWGGLGYWASTSMKNEKSTTRGDKGGEFGGGSPAKTASETKGGANLKKGGQRGGRQGLAVENHLLTRGKGNWEGGEGKN